jgi:uncharacterized membrane protein
MSDDHIEHFEALFRNEAIAKTVLQAGEIELLRQQLKESQERERSVTVGMVTAALAAVGEYNVSLSSTRRMEVTKMIQAAFDWKPTT